VLDLSWQDGAACKGRNTADFYVEADDYPDVIAELRELCESCAVLPKCQIYALEWEYYGFWGGMTMSQRRAARRQFGIKKRSLRSANLQILEGGKREARNNLERARAVGVARRRPGSLQNPR